MASRSHRSMPPGHSYWGSFAGTANLPNVSGAPIQSAKVQVGDVAFETVTAGVYVCTTATVGAAVWTPLKVNTSPTLFRPSSASDFALLSRDAGTDLALSFGTMGAEPFYDQITLTTGAGSTPGTTWFELVGFSMPTTNRFRIMGKLGPRATATSGVNPQIGFAVQTANRSCWFQRDSSSTQLMVVSLRNENTTPSTAAAVNVGVGPNATPGGGDFFADVVLRQPSSGVDPAWEVNFYGFGNAAGSGINGEGNRLHSLSTSITGGSPPSGGWDAAWQSGGNLKICVGGFEYAGAGSSFIAGFRVQKHPLDW